MKILFNTNNVAFQNKGGGEIQLLKTKEYLEKQGINIHLFDSWNNDIKKFDIFHNFSIATNCYDIINLAHHKKMPIAISTIFWPSTEYALKGNIGFANKIKSLAYNFINKYNLFGLSKVKIMLDKADILFPNSEIEGKIIQKVFKIDPKKIHPVPNGVDERFYNADPKEFIEKYSLKDFILYVGRIEPRKNVLNLIKAANKLGKDLVIIGKPHPQNPDYTKLCKETAGPNIHFLGSIPHDSSLLESAYATAKVYALPSWYETPGLAALEAGLAGANIVITPKGSTKEYFEDYAFYADPNSVEHIKLKLEQAFNKEKTKELADHIKNNFLWEHVAKKTIEGYNKIKFS